jgi:GNAT superfamily N-acetyltransferase
VTELAGAIRIVAGGPERVPDLEHLSRSLHRFHVGVDPGVPGIPPRDGDGWWRIRSARETAWLTLPDAFVLVAEDGDVPVGYALVSFHEEDDSHATGVRFAEVHTLAVAPERRGQGIGTALLHEVYRRVRALGVGEMLIGVLATNDRALAFYEREGFRPWVTMTLGKVPDPDAV